MTYDKQHPARNGAGSTIAVYGPGHNSFVQAPDETEDWIVYHGIDGSGGGWEQCSVRAQPFGWHLADIPDFRHPVPPGHAGHEPAGTMASDEL